MSLILTRLQNLRAAAKLDKNEYRMSRYGAHELFRLQTDDANGIISPDLLDKGLRSIGRTLETAVIDYNAPVNITNVRTLTIPDDENTSRMIQIAFATVSFGFTMTPDLYDNNEIGYEQDWNRKMTKYLYAIAAAQDSAALATLETFKTQVLGDTLGGQYSLTSNTLRVPLAFQDQVLGDINPLQAGNDYYEGNIILGNPALDSLVRNRLLEQGAFQSSDKTYQFQDKGFLFTNRLQNAANTKATGFAISGSHLGMIVRLERAALARRRASTGHEWGVVNLPLLNIPCGTYYYETVADRSAIAGAASADLTRNMVEHYGFSYDYAYVTAYNSDAATQASPVIKFEVATT